MVNRKVLITAVLALSFAACERDAGITEPKSASTPMGLAAVGIDPVSGARIETNQDDYAPGEIVHVTGSGWAPNETVHLDMTEDPDTHPDVTQDVQADSTGAFSIHFYDVQQHDLGVTFTLTATGLTSGSQATAVFTDNVSVTSITLNGLSAVTVAAGASISANVQGAVNGGGSQHTLGAIGIKAFVHGANPNTATSLACFDVSPDIVWVSGGAINYSQTFSFNAPSTADTYDVIATSYSDNTCGSSVQSLTAASAITIQIPNTAPTLSSIGNQPVDEGSTLNFTATASDTDLPAQTLTFSLVGAPAGATITSGGAFSWTPTDGPSQTATFTVKVTDNGTAPLSDEESITVTVNNVVPTATFTAPASVSAGSPISLSLAGPADASSDDVTAGFMYAFDCGTGSGYAAYSGMSTASCPTTLPGSRTVKGKIKDKDAGEKEYTASVAIDNVPPTADAGGPYSGNEGSAISISGSGVDADGGIVTYEWSVSPNDGHCSFANANAVSTTVTCNDDGSWTLTLKVTDDELAFTTDDATLTVSNLAPTIGVHTLGASVNEGTSIAFGISNVGDPSSVDQSAGFTYAFACDAVTFGSYGSSTTTSCPAGDGPGSVTIAAKAKDKDGGESSPVSSTFTVLNVAPSATFDAPSPVNEGSSIAPSLTGPSDPSSADVVAGFEYAFDCGSGYGAFGSNNSASCATTDNGSRTVKGKVRDKDGGTREYTANVVIDNVAPTAAFSAPSSVPEGTDINLSLGSPYDPSSDDVAAGFRYAFNCGSGYGAYGTGNSATCPTTDDASPTVKGKIKDKDGDETEYSGSVTVTNVAPSITSVTVPIDPVATTTPVTVTWAFTDPGTDTWTCEISWDNGQPFEAATYVATKSCSATKTLPAGIYTVTVRVSDDNGGSDQEMASTYIVVYDPNGGFVTGGGWITSPAGAYPSAPSLTGKATFGFVSKYVKGKTLPTGNTEFQFHAAGMNFSSTLYQWLVVSGSLAQYKGEGTINGAGSYMFILSATDGQVSGGGGIDKFRIKIWDKTTSAVIYDNQMSAAEDATPTTAIASGSIVIHSK